MCPVCSKDRVRIDWSLDARPSSSFWSFIIIGNIVKGRLNAFMKRGLHAHGLWGALSMQLLRVAGLGGLLLAISAQEISVSILFVCSTKSDAKAEVEENKFGWRTYYWKPAGGGQEQQCAGSARFVGLLQSLFALFLNEAALALVTPELLFPYIVQVFSLPLDAQMHQQDHTRCCLHWRETGYPLLGRKAIAKP